MSHPVHLGRSSARRRPEASGIRRPTARFLARLVGAAPASAFVGLAPAAAVAGLAAVASADVSVPAILSDGMVLQQQAQASLWGWGRPGEVVSVTPSWPGAASVTVRTDEHGRWRALVSTPEAGGPYSIAIAGDTSVVIRDVLVGEVWVCSGQSNMEWPLAAIGPAREGPHGRSPSAEEEIASATDGRIRLFNVPNTVSAHDLADAAGRWTACSPETAGRFSAVAYFFARELADELGVPVGLVTSDWGGTPAESWVSGPGLASFPEFRSSLEFLRSVRSPETRGSFVQDARAAWWSGLDRLPGGAGPAWATDGFDASGWPTMNLPATLGPEGLDRFDGVVYFRREIDLPEAWAGIAARLELGPIDDRDEAFVNGVLVGGTRDDGRWASRRSYDVPTGLLRAGRNVIGVRVLDTGGAGGVNGAAADLKLMAESGLGLPLAGAWSWRRGPSVGDLPPIPDSPAIGPSTPSVLYSGMIAPLTPMTIRGVIWYQGESNVGRAAQYRELFPALIADWRRAWGQPGLPFYFAQIAPFRYGGEWGAGAELRSAQASTALKVPNTGMACLMDLGDERDIHPAHKQEVGRRLALQALAKTYQRAGVIADGPALGYNDWDVANLRATNAEGLRWTPEAEAAPPHRRGFLIAGEDMVFHEADANIRGNFVHLKSPKVSRPVAVRYAWGSSDEATLVNGAGLPASSFELGQMTKGPHRYEDRGRTDHLSDEPGYVVLFNGRDLSGWVNVNCDDSTWVARGGRIACSGFPTGLLRTEGRYENFVLELEWRHLRHGGNAGLFVWSDPVPVRGQPFTRSVEVQVMDGLEGDWYTSDGDVFPIHGSVMTPENGRPGSSRAYPTSRRANPSPEWNHYRVECVNGDLTLWVNGEPVTRGRAASPREGYICLESEGSPAEFRNIRLWERPPAAPPIDAGHAAAPDRGFRPLYNGVDFEGWAFGPEHEGHWRAEDWTIAFDGEGADLWTTASYGDFELIADWRWTGPATPADRPVILPTGEQALDASGQPATARVPDAGDSGIYLRGSSKAQVNIWCWPVGSGEVYGYRTDESLPANVRAAVTPRKAADAPIGQWNRFEITMKGDRLSVVLNGERVIDNAPLPGVAATGPIALQMHHAPIEFANLYIRELK